jgi:hypothetical protein
MEDGDTNVPEGDVQRNFCDAFNGITQAGQDAASPTEADMREKLAPQLRRDCTTSGDVDRECGELLQVAEAMSWRWAAIVQPRAHRGSEEFQGSAETPALGE